MTRPRLVSIALGLAVLSSAGCPDETTPQGTSDAALDAGDDLARDGQVTPPDGGDFDIVEGGIGWPCVGNTDCDSGWCVEGPDGYVCTKTCDADCPTGWDCKSVQSGADLFFLCVPRTRKLCTPCQQDIQCSGGACIDYGQDSGCAYSCDEAADCPSGFDCATDPTGAHPGETYCIPTTQSCSCNIEADGGQRSCTSTNDFGTCFGVQTCDTDLGWLPCTAPDPADEDCDGIDNDCNGLIDDGLAVGEACENTVSGVGSCPGVTVCQGPGGWVCQGLVPTEEVCDYIDNDCDGTTDAEFRDADGNWTLDEHCGQCGNDCDGKIVNGTGTCGGSAESPVCEVAACDEGYVQINPYQCLPPLDVGCQPCSTDLDCYGGTCATVDGQKSCVMPCAASDPVCPDGYSCHQLPTGEERCTPDSGTCTCTPATEGQKRTCQVENQYGSCFGIQTCVSDIGWTPCSASDPEPETCDGYDNNCNGLVDDNLADEGQPCSNSVPGVGSCTGTWVCLADQGMVCQGPTPTAETCDFKDNDCDGKIDEDFRDPDGFWTQTQNCGTCGNNCLFKIDGGTGKCGGSPTSPVCVVDSCDTGLVKINEFQCNVPPDVSCQPCVTDAECFGGSCLQLDGQNVCVMPCEQFDSGCPASFACDDIGGGAERCVPVTGTCTCTAAVDGQQAACVNENAEGKCYGIRTCDASVGWSTCTAATPSAETCDGVDNDCDGVVDDAIAEVGQPCQNTVSGVGSCDGIYVCLGTQGLQCNGQTPVPEICNYQDDNCDGQIDEDYKTGGQYTDFDHCGACNTSCAIGFPNAETVECSAASGQAQCQVVTCQEGYFKINPFQCIPNVANICQECSDDSNCLGEDAACVQLAEGKFCGQACTGAADCPEGFDCQDVGAAADQCVPSTGSCGCDGTNTNLSRACSVTYTPPDPDKPETTCNGIEQCTTSGWGPCQLPAEECDGADNDCDGQIDEDYKTGGVFASVEHCGGCNISCLALGVPNANAVCDTGGAVPQCDYECKPSFFDVDGSPTNGCECSPIAGPDLAGDGVDSNCDGIDGDKTDAIFVAKDGDDGNDGSFEMPKRTIGAGISAADAQGKRDVYVATGVYSESVTLQDGVGVFGGYSADFDVRDPLLYETAIIGKPPTGAKPGAVTAEDLGAAGAPDKTILRGFTVFGANAANVAGANSYAIYLRNVGSQLEIRGNVVFGGAGGNGSQGGSGSDGLDGVGGATGEPAYDVGKIQASGTRTCAAADELAGGAGGVRLCGATDVSGGTGGMAHCPVYGDDPASETSGATGLGPAGGAGGVNGWDSEIDTTSSCGSCSTPPGNNPWEGTAGAPGTPGSFGGPGSGCSSTAGSVVAGHWVAGGGASGAAGSHGSGGGGGGAGGGVEVTGTQCEVPPPPENGDCCSTQSTPGCSVGSIETCVCAQDSFCCSDRWDSYCVDEVGDFGCGTACPAQTYIAGHDMGGSGGGGGSGGCAGTGGAGGSGGGGSFGIFLTWDAAATSVPVLQDNLIERGSGGVGGPGGPGGAGGVGGAGAPASASGSGDSLLFCAAGGSPGGDGGQGGHGGGGGGGCGGSTYGIFAHNQGGADLTSYKTANTFAGGGSGGPGGPGGASLGSSGSAGAAGAAADTNF